MHKLTLTMFSMLVYLSLSATVFALTIFDGKSGAWSSASQNNQAAIAARGSDFVVCYNADMPLATVQSWLTTANNQGLMVIMELPRSIVAAQNVAAIQTYINALNSYPAVVAWYIFDEPVAGDLQKCTTAYNTIHAISAKPVTMCLSTIGTISTFQNCYDFILLDCYRAFEGYDAFDNIISYNSEYQVDAWRIFMDDAVSEIGSVGKDWLCVQQAFGRGAVVGPPYRLPTYEESRYMMNFVVHRGAKAVIFWAHPYIETSYALGSEAYPYSGYQWIEDVYKPLIKQANTVSAALTTAHDETGISDNNDYIWTRHYLDPVSGVHYLRALNCYQTAQNNVTFTINKAGYTKLQEVMCPKILDCTNKNTTLNLAPYEVQWYVLEP